MTLIGYLSGDTAYCLDCFSGDPTLVTPIMRSTEADTPTHCTDCEVLIPHALTSDGLLYVAMQIDTHVRDKLLGITTGRVAILGRWWNEYQEQFFGELWHDGLLRLMLQDYFDSMPTIDEYSPLLAKMLGQVSGVYPHRWVVIDHSRKVANGPFVTLNMAGAVSRGLSESGRRPETYPLQELGGKP